jgi:hypothetical protein
MRMIDTKPGFAFQKEEGEVKYWGIETLETRDTSIRRQRLILIVELRVRYTSRVRRHIQNIWRVLYLILLY